MTDIFARIAMDRYVLRSKNLVAPEPVPVPNRTLPLDKRPGDSAFTAPRKICTPQELRRDLAQARRATAKYLRDFAPAITSSRIVRPLERFAWRKETEADRRNFPATLAGKGKWTPVEIPHYGPPLGRAVTYYRTKFTVTPAMLTKGALFVAFSGVDYKAHVFVNGALLGSHEGFFAPFEFDFTPHARRGDNILLVKVENDHICMGSVGGVSGKSLDGDKIFAGTGLGYDDPVLGWHSNPAAMGITQGVRIEARSRLFIRDIFVRPLPDENRAEAWIEVQHCNLDNAAVSFNLSLFGQNFRGTVFRNRCIVPTTVDIRGHSDLNKGTKPDIQEHAGPGISQFRLSFDLPKARRWNLGTPWLYQLQVKLLNDAGATCDIQKQQFGMRIFRQDVDSEPKGKFYLNGREIRLRGANTMGFEQQCVFRRDWKQLVDDILLAKLCHMNFLRLTQRPVQREVYDYCDRLGLMTQTDLPLFACLHRNQLCEAVRQAEEMERLVRPHACNILVSYINEPFPNGYGKPHRNLIRSELEDFFDMASRAIRISNPERVIKYVDGDYDPPTFAGMPDNHCYCGWYIGHAIDLGRLNRGYWVSVKDGWHYGCGEYGSEGLDSLGVMRKYYPKDWLPLAKKQPTEPWRPDRLAMSQTNRFHHVWFPSQTTPKAWIEASQTHQAWVTRLMTEQFRRDTRMNTFAIHLFIDAWPCGWMKAIMDVDRTPKKAYFSYRDALTPLMVSLRADRHAYFAGETVEMDAWVCNDTHQVPPGAELRYQLEIGGRVVQSGRVAAEIPRCSATPQGFIRFTLPQMLAQRTPATVRIGLASRSGQILFAAKQEIEVFPVPVQSAGRRAFIMGGRNGPAATLAGELGLKRAFTGALRPTDVILVDDPAALMRRQSAFGEAVRAGATALLMEFPVGRHVVTGCGFTVAPAGMGPRHFVDGCTGHPIGRDLQPYDCWFWHDSSVGYASPLLERVLDPAPVGWTALLESGNGSWATDWKPAPAAAEVRVGQGVIRVCQVKLAHRTKTNPVAAILARRLLEINETDKSRARSRSTPAFIKLDPTTVRGIGAKLCPAFTSRPMPYSFHKSRQLFDRHTATWNPKVRKHNRFSQKIL